MYDNTETVADDTSVQTDNVQTETPTSDELDLTIEEIIKLNEGDFPEFKDDARHKGMKLQLTCNTLIGITKKLLIALWLRLRIKT